MTLPSARAAAYLEPLRAEDPQALQQRLSPKPERPLPSRIRPQKYLNAKSLAETWAILHAQGHVDATTQTALADAVTLDTLERYQANIESCIGTVKVPVGVIGPLRINGLHAQGDFYVPLATTEASLVASYGRGARLLSAAGGCTAILLSDGLSRSPGFAFKTVLEAGQFLAWALAHLDVLKAAAEATTRHGKLLEVRPHLEANHLYLVCEYATGDASGQNMATLATEAFCQALLTQCPISPEYWFLEANFSGDKKASAQAFLGVRGKKVTAEAYLPEDLLHQHLHTDSTTLQRYWRMSALGGVMSGTLGVQGHYANGLAALYLATGQDVACVAESSVGVTRLEATTEGLYAAVTLPNIMVGTVGGGTGLPTQHAGLQILGLAGTGHAAALAEVTASICLAGELSLIGAICAGQFANAHQRLARLRSHTQAP